jgi:hypothetical protein
MKKVLVITAVSSAIIISSFIGFTYGYGWGKRIGRMETNMWWVNQKSVYFDTNAILEKRRLKNHCLI